MPARYVNLLTIILLEVNVFNISVYVQIILCPFDLLLPYLPQSVPQFSPLTFTIEGEDTDNQIEVGQSAADDSSPLQVYTEEYKYV